MNKLINYTLWLVIGVLVSVTAFGQAPGSGNTENSIRYVGGTRTTLGESLYIGPGANITVDGTWHVYSKYVWISPLAQISGTGTIIFHNSADVSGSGGPTIIDGNDNLFIDVNIVHNNNTGMAINNVALPESLAVGGWADNSSMSTLKIGKDFDMNVDGADVWLDATSNVTGDFVFDSNATISNYRPERMVITNNSIQSHMVKQGATGGFIFPVGISDGNYTPAQITGSGTYHVSVQGYAASASNETLLNGGPERTWHVYADVTGAATVALQHNAPTDVPPFDSATAHFVTQYLGAAWSTGTEEAGLPGVFTTGGSPIATASTQDLSAVNIPVSGSDPTSYLTKANKKTSLPVTLISFTTKNEEGIAKLTWFTSEETNADRFEIQRSSDTKNWIYLGSKTAAGESKTTNVYMFADASPVNGTNYYRLKMVDKDGTYTFSRIQSVYLEKVAFDMVAYPNPAVDMLYLKGLEGTSLSSENLKEISIVDSRGISVYHSRKISQILNDGIKVRDFATGIYIVKITKTDGTSKLQKIVIIK